MQTSPTALRSAHSLSVARVGDTALRQQGLGVRRAGAWGRPSCRRVHRTLGRQRLAGARKGFSGLMPFQGGRGPSATTGTWGASPWARHRRQAQLGVPIIGRLGTRHGHSPISPARGTCACLQVTWSSSLLGKEWAAGKADCCPQQRSTAGLRTERPSEQHSRGPSPGDVTRASSISWSLIF